MTLKNTLFPLLLCTSAIIALFGLEKGISKYKTTWVELPRQTPQSLPPHLVKTMSFGMLPMVVDWLWIRAIQDPAYTHVTEGTHPPAFYDIDLATKLDPAFFLGYWAGGSILVIVRDDVEGGKQILERGEEFRRTQLSSWSPELIAKHWPAQWQMLILLGYVHTFELKNLAEGIKYYRIAADTEGAGPILKRIASRMDEPDGLYVIGEKIVQALYNQSKERNDPIEAQEKLARQHKSLVVNHFVFNLNLEWSKEKKKSAAALEAFLSRKSIVGDMFGGRLFLGKDGKIDSTTDRDHTVMGIKS